MKQFRIPGIVHFDCICDFVMSSTKLSAGGNCMDKILLKRMHVRERYMIYVNKLKMAKRIVHEIDEMAIDCY